MRRRLLSLIILSAVLSNSNAQETNIYDTVEIARTKAFQKDFREADRLLTLYTASNTEIHSLRLHAQVLYWMKDFTRSAQVFETALAAFPKTNILKLDFGRLLFETNNLHKAQLFLQDYLSADSMNAEANILVSYIDLWKGRLSQAKDRSLRMLSWYPGNKESIGILQEISNQTTPYLNTHFQLLSDDQPINAFATHVEFARYSSRFFYPSLKFTINRFDVSGNISGSSIVQAGNQFTLGKFSLSLVGGVFQTNKSDLKFAGKVAASQKISNKFTADVLLEKRPYQYTIASVKTAVVPLVQSIAFRYNKSERWLGKAEYERQSFVDDNHIQTAYFWLLAPIVSKEIINIKTGYGFNYADAQTSKYESNEPLNVIRVKYPLYSQLPGTYNPYFTPMNQVSNSWLILVKSKVSGTVTLSCRGSFGFSARADNPYLYLDKSPSNALFVNKTSYSLKYTPVEVLSDVSVKLSNRLSTTAVYTYRSLLFFKRQEGLLQLKYLFVHDKKA
ncbi:tetratricopeptide repeat protein [Segetibacter sp. 3557_3]|uniref:tetratricopeptide repeat protein n=1 Tax=Segetibacter sp. 3557_3 TaxID=2547429 RepID=UPI001058A02D|nr:tetratricopeptide repeat protein [Segetibacter sp. 3557_3]TDH19743.1 tetratricopeptide repeat protein [Segetibacter sp. 3557_3]